MSFDISWRPHIRGSMWVGVEATISKETAKQLGIEIAEDLLLHAPKELHAPKKIEVNELDKIRKVLLAHAEYCKARDASKAAGASTESGLNILRKFLLSRAEYCKTPDTSRAVENEISKTNEIARATEKEADKARNERCQQAINRSLANLHFFIFKRHNVEHEQGIQIRDNPTVCFLGNELVRLITPEQRAYYFEHWNLLQRPEVLGLINCGVTEQERNILATKQVHLDLEIASALAKAPTISATPLAPPAPFPVASAPADKGDSKTS